MKWNSLISDSHNSDFRLSRTRIGMEFNQFILNFPFTTWNYSRSNVFWWYLGSISWYQPHKTHMYDSFNSNFRLSRIKGALVYGDYVDPRCTAWCYGEFLLFSIVNINCNVVLQDEKRSPGPKLRRNHLIRRQISDIFV